MRVGAFPDNLNVAKVVPILNSGTEKFPQTTDRSGLTYLSKIFGKVLYVRLNDYFTKNNLLSQQQYGFRNNHSTSMAITGLYEILLQNLDDSLLSCAVYLDQRKSFHSVNHSILLEKLEDYGLRGNAFKLLQPYHSKRK